jgi:hypothetical protein
MKLADTSVSLPELLLRAVRREACPGGRPASALGRVLPAAPACGRACARAEWLQPSRGCAFPRAFRRRDAASFPERRLHAASSSSTHEAPDRHCCRGPKPARDFRSKGVARLAGRMARDHSKRASGTPTSKPELREFGYREDLRAGKDSALDHRTALFSSHKGICRRTPVESSWQKPAGNQPPSQRKQAFNA